MPLSLSCVLQQQQQQLPRLLFLLRYLKVKRRPCDLHIALFYYTAIFYITCYIVVGKCYVDGKNSVWLMRKWLSDESDSWFHLLRILIVFSREITSWKSLNWNFWCKLQINNQIWRTGKYYKIVIKRQTKYLNGKQNTKFCSLINQNRFLVLVDKFHRKKFASTGKILKLPKPQISNKLFKNFQLQLKNAISMSSLLNYYVTTISFLRYFNLLPTFPLFYKIIFQQKSNCDLHKQKSYFQCNKQ